MSWRPQMEALLCVVLLLVTLVCIAIKTLTPVTASNDTVILDIQAMPVKTYPGFTTSFEFEAPWDKGAFWDDEAPAYDLSQSNRSSGLGR